MDTEYQSTPIQNAYREARRVAGKQAVYETLREHGAASGMLEDVPPRQLEKCLVALRRLANGGDVAPATKQAAAFADVRRQAYGERKPAPAVTRLDPTDIYARWNSVRIERD